MNFELNITIVGMGIIGGSYGMALKRAGYSNVWGVDLDQKILDKAIEKRAIDRGFLDIEEPISNSDIVVIAVYPELTKKLIVSNMDKFKSGAIVTDVAGIKEDLLESVKDTLRDDVDFIPGHPMAGKETSGIDSADPEIFEGANYILTPTESNRAENIELLTDIIYRMGFGNVVKTSPSKHDENIAYVSQLPHIVAVGMVNCKDIESVENFAAGSYRDTTRIAKINADLWSELFIENKKHLVNQIDLFLAYTKKLRDSIESEDIDSLKEMLAESHSRKEDI